MHIRALINSQFDEDFLDTTAHNYHRAFVLMDSFRFMFVQALALSADRCPGLCDVDSRWLVARLPARQSRHDKLHPST